MPYIPYLNTFFYISIPIAFQFGKEMTFYPSGLKCKKNYPHSLKQEKEKKKGKDQANF